MVTWKRMRVRDLGVDEQHVKGFGQRESFGAESDKEDEIVTAGNIGMDLMNETASTPFEEQTDDYHNLESLHKHTNRALFLLMMEEREYQAEIDAIEADIQAALDEVNDISVLHTSESLRRDPNGPNYQAARVRADVLNTPAHELANTRKFGDLEQSIELSEGVEARLRLAERLAPQFQLKVDNLGHAVEFFKEAVICAPPAELNTLLCAQFAKNLPLKLDLSIPKDIRGLVEGYAEEHACYMQNSPEGDEDVIDEFKRDVAAFAQHAGLGIHTADLMARMAVSARQGKQTLEPSDEPTWDLSRQLRLQSAAEYYPPGAIALADKVEKNKVNDKKRKRGEPQMAEEDVMRARKRQRKKENKKRKRAEKQAKLAKDTEKTKARQKLNLESEDGTSAPHRQQDMEGEYHNQAESTMSVIKSNVEVAHSSSKPRGETSNAEPKKRKRPNPNSEVSIYVANPQANVANLLGPGPPHTSLAKPSTNGPICSPYFTIPPSPPVLVMAASHVSSSSFSQPSQTSAVKPIMMAFGTQHSGNSLSCPISAASTLTLCFSATNSRQSRPAGMSRSTWRSLNWEQEGRRPENYVEVRPAANFLNDTSAPALPERLDERGDYLDESTLVKGGSRQDILHRAVAPLIEFSPSSERLTKKRKRKRNKNRLFDASPGLFKVSDPSKQVKAHVVGFLNDLPADSKHPMPRSPESMHLHERFHENPEQHIANQSKPRSKVAFTAGSSPLSAAPSELRNTKLPELTKERNLAKGKAEQFSAAVAENSVLGPLEVPGVESLQHDEGSDVIGVSAKVCPPLLKTFVTEPEAAQIPVLSADISLKNVHNFKESNVPRTCITPPVRILEERDHLSGKALHKLARLSVHALEKDDQKQSTSNPIFPLMSASAVIKIPTQLSAQNHLMELRQKIAFLEEQLRTVADAVTRLDRDISMPSIVGIPTHNLQADIHQYQKEDDPVKKILNAEVKPERNGDRAQHGNSAGKPQPEATKLGALIGLSSGKIWYPPQLPRRNSNSHYSPPSTPTPKKKRRVTIGSRQSDVGVVLTPSEMSAQNTTPLPITIRGIRRISAKFEPFLTHTATDTAPSKSKAPGTAKQSIKGVHALVIGRDLSSKDLQREVTSSVAAIVPREQNFPSESSLKLPTSQLFSTDPDAVCDELLMVENSPKAVLPLLEPQNDARLQHSTNFSPVPTDMNLRLRPETSPGVFGNDSNDDAKGTQLAISDNTNVVDCGPDRLEPAQLSACKAKPKSKVIKSPVKSPYFFSSTPKKEKSECSEQVARRQPPASTSSLPRLATGLVSCTPFPRLDSENGFGLIQEKYANDPFRLLIAVTFLIRTHGKVAIPVFYQLIEKYPTPEALYAADKQDVVEIFQCLGLQNHRATICQRYAEMFICDPPVRGRRYVVKNYPTEESTLGLKHGEVFKEDCSCEAWEIGHMTSGHYALDSWRIFCRDKLRGLADGWNGEGAPANFQPEWKRVLPVDKELRAFLRWMWLKDDYEWDPLTGDIEVADPKLAFAAREGWVSYNDHGQLRIKEEGPRLKFILPRCSPSCYPKTTVSSFEEPMTPIMEPAQDLTPVSGICADTSSSVMPAAAPYSPVKAVNLNTGLRSAGSKSEFLSLALPQETEDDAKASLSINTAASSTSQAGGANTEWRASTMVSPRQSLQDVAQAALAAKDNIPLKLPRVMDDVQDAYDDFRTHEPIFKLLAAFQR